MLEKYWGGDDVLMQGLVLGAGDPGYTDGVNFIADKIATALLWGQPWDERMPLSEDTLYTSPPKPKHPRTPPRPKNSALSARDGQQQDRGEADQEGSPRGNKRTPLAGEDMSRYGVFTRVRKNLMAHDLPAAEKV